MPTINKGSDYFGVLTYTGDGAASKTVVDTSAVTFQPDFVWIKGRSGATDHALYDAVRGTTKDLVSNSTAAETTQSTGLTSFVNGGFTIGNLAKLNTSGATYTAWCWKANGAGSSNTNGTITSTVSVNTTAGFSVVTYTGNGTAGATVGHGLGVAPKFIIVKGRSNAVNWIVYSEAAGTNQYLELNNTGAKQAQSSYNMFNSTAPTSSVFSLGNLSNTNGSTVTYVAYCWAEIAGFSKFGSYTGNGSTDGAFVFTNFRPKFIMLKKSSDVSNWTIFDTSMNPYNVSSTRLYPNLSNAQDTNLTVVDILSNGFKFRDSNDQWNTSGGTYVYACFAENPLKNALAR
jgi:hypothetical protein